MRVGLRLGITRIEPDVDMIFLANRESSTLGTACARGETDIHVTGAINSEYLLATTSSANSTIELNPEYIGKIYEGEEEGSTIVELSDRTRVNLTASRVALAIDGTVANTLSGQATVELKDVAAAAESGTSTIVDVTYPNWNAISSVVSLSNPTLIDIDTGDVLTAKFTTNVETDAECKEAQKVLEKIYTTAMKLREVVKYEPAALLTKSVMRVPVGIDGTTFDAVSNVVDRPTALSDDAFESLAHACLKIALAVDEPGNPAVSMSDFMADTSIPSIKASENAHKVANALSTLVCMICPYRVDGRTMVLPTGLKMVGSEAWKDESPRDLFSTDDCEGSGAIITSLVYHAETIARDPELAARYPHIAAISNALIHHMVGIAVLAANAGQADAAGKKGHDVVAGHAIALAVPKPHALKSMINGIMSTDLYNDDGDGDAQTRMAQKSTEPYSLALYHIDDLRRMPADESEILATSVGVLSLVEAVDLVPLAVEGTSPVASTKLYEPDATARLAHIKAVRLEKAFEEKIGPGLSRTVARLHVPESHNGPGHQFYKKFVEFAVPTRRSGFFQNSDMRALGFATAQWVLTELHNSQSAGAGPEDLATGNFGLLPLWMLNEAECSTFDVASAEARSNSLPIRKNAVNLTQKQYDTYMGNMNTLNKLSSSKSALFSSKSETTHLHRHIISFAALVNNEDSVKVLFEQIGHNPNIACRVTMIATPNLIFSQSGEDLGEIPYVEMFEL